MVYCKPQSCLSVLASVDGIHLISLGKFKVDICWNKGPWPCDAASFDFEVRHFIQRTTYRINLLFRLSSSSSRMGVYCLRSCDEGRCWWIDILAKCMSAILLETFKHYILSLFVPLQEWESIYLYRSCDEERWWRIDKLAKCMSAILLETFKHCLPSLF